MKALHTVLLLSSLALVTLSHAAKDRTKFIESHHVDKTLSKILDEHSELLSSLVKEVHESPYQKHGVWKFDWLPGYYVKYNLKRLFMRERIASCIENHSLTLLHTPRKFLYHLQGRPRELHSLNYVVIAEELHTDPAADAEPMNLQQVKQFITLIEKTGHCSTYAHNYLRLEKGIISFIDTDGTFNIQNPVRGIIDLLNRNLSSYYTAEALIYIIDRLAVHLMRLEGQDLKAAKSRIASVLADQKRELSLKITQILTERCKAYRQNKSGHKSSLPTEVYS